MSTFKTKVFRDLHKAWMKKLKVDGFTDIEDTSSQNEYLKVWDSMYFLNKAEHESYDNTQTYYQVAEELLNTHQFDSDIEKQVWSYHADGLAVREIESMLYNKNNKLNKDKINTIIQRLQKFVGRR
jgi:hypothetical protein